MKFSDKKNLNMAISVFVAISAAIVVFFVIYRIGDIGSGLMGVASAIMPFIFGGVVAYVLSPLCSIFEKWFFRALKKTKDEDKREKLALGLSVFVVLMIALVFIFVLLVVIVPQLVNSIIKLATLLPPAVESGIAWIRTYLIKNQTVYGYVSMVIDKIYAFVSDWFSNGFLTQIENIATGFSSGVYNVVVTLVDVFIGFIVAAYILVGRRKYKQQFKMVIYGLLKRDRGNKVIQELKFADDVFSGFINGKLLDSLLVGVVLYVGMLLFRIFNPGAELVSEVLIGVIIGVCNIIPFFGQYIGVIVCGLLTLIINPGQFIFFLIYDIVMMQIDANIVSPKILGNTMGISGMWVLFAILFFGYLWGFVGMLIGVPVFAVIYHFISNFILSRLHKNGEDKMIEYYTDEFCQEKEKNKTVK